MADATVGLADAIAALRKELLAAVAEGANAAMRFRLAPVELSMQVAVTKDAGGEDRLAGARAGRLVLLGGHADAGAAAGAGMGAGRRYLH
jgi:Trypsin-co-occurring domain 2